MVDKGNYDQAIRYAVDKLEGQKNKKTKYVRALEKAYLRVNREDADRIAFLESSRSLDRYDKIYDIYTIMSQRQKTISRLMPLVSEDGYVADIQIVNYIPLLTTTAEAAAESHYQEAKRLLDIAEVSDKYAARTAYRRLSYIERYFDQYKNTDELYTKAYQLGLDHVAVSVAGADHHILPLSNVLYDVDVTQLNNFWTQYYIGATANIPYDYTVTIQLDIVDPGMEREHYNTYTESKEVEDGVTPVVDLNGNTVLDTLGNVVYTKKYTTIHATVTEVIREKQASVLGRTIIYSNNNSSLVKSIPISLTHHFDDYQASYQGDTRALSKETKRKLGRNLSAFPSDYDMILAMTSDFRDFAYDVLRRDIR